MKYLFTATFQDGTEYNQNLEDKGITLKEDGNATSCYGDVCAMQQEKQLIMFELAGLGHRYRVDLRDGHFEVDGVGFKMHEEIDLNNLRLVYFRDHTIKFNQQHEEVTHDIVFRFGWQANDTNGKNIQHVMMIN